MANPIEPNNTQPARLMIIDDDKSITDLIAKIGVESGYVVLCVNRSQEISERYKSLQPQMIFLDLDLVERDGLPLKGLKQ